MVFDPKKYGPKVRKKPKKIKKYLDTALCCAFWAEERAQLTIYLQCE